MDILHRRSNKVMEINANFLGAVFTFAYGWWLWPEDPRWYGFYLVGTLSFLGSIGFIIKAVRLMKEMYLQDKTVADYQAKVKPQRDAELASDQLLQEAGMIDG